ncbi:MAG: hypothetical protein JWL77_4792 [Chthonomonadaceae bacterium]|nr:hypothetical protein [Chthonomonadaceae bacterium]
MLLPPLEAQPGESFRRLFLRLPETDVSEGDATAFDGKHFAATLKRSHVEVITLVVPDEGSVGGETSGGRTPGSPDGDLQSRLAAACRGQGLRVDEAIAAEQEAGAMLASFASRPALEAACYHRLCRGRPLVLEDWLCPKQTFDAEAYRLLGIVFGDVAFKEPWCRGARPLVEIGIVSAPNPTASGVGAARILQAGGHAFDLLEVSADFTPYRVLILPEDIPCDSAFKARVQAYLQQGGSLLAAFETSHTAEQSGYRVPGEVIVIPNYGLVAPGVGNVTLLGEPHFRSYAQSAGTRHKRSVLEALNLLLPAPLLRHDGPGTLEAIVTEQPEYNRWVMHLMHYLPMGFALDSPVRDDILPVHEVKFSLKTPKPVVRIELRPQHHDELDFWEYQGRVEFVVPKIIGHRMVSIEFAKESAE